MMKSKAKMSDVLYNILLYGVMGFYFLILLLILFGKRDIGSFRSVNLIPFKEISAYLFDDNIVRRTFGFSNILGNIVIFIPLGLYISLLNRKGKIIFNTVFVMLISAAAEIMQYVLMVGAADIDDIILNTLGGLIGAGAFYLLSLIFKHNVRKAVAFIAPIGGIALVFLLFN